MTKKFNQALWQVDGKGTCTNIILGSTNFTLDEIFENAKQILDQVAENSPRGWNFIKSVHVKLEKSIALEVYVKDPP